MATYAIDDDYGNQITAGLDSYDTAMQRARRYLSAHTDASNVTIYDDQPDGESWELERYEVLS